MRFDDKIRSGGHGGVSQLRQGGGFVSEFEDEFSPAQEADSHERADSLLDLPARFSTSKRISNVLFSL